MRASLFHWIFVFLFFSGVVFSQPDYEYPIKNNSKALQFSALNNFTIGDFQGGAISFKYHLTKGSAIRGGVSYGVSFLDEDYAGQNTIYDTSVTTLFGKQKSNSKEISASIQYLWQMEGFYSTSFFYGAGPSFGIIYNYRFINLEESGPLFNETREQINKMRLKYFGASLVLGVEWFASKSISLHAEYGASLNYYWSKEELNYYRDYDSGLYIYKYKTNERLETKIWRFETRTVKLGLSVYF